MKDELNWKPEGMTPLDTSKKRWTDKPNQNFLILEVDNLEILANDREEWRWQCGAVMGLMTCKTCLEEEVTGRYDCV